jgi:multiple sugar transport system permease protein
MTLPYTIWMMRGFFETIPMEVQEAALVDGCSRLGAMLRISLPLAVPGIVGAGLYAFETSWNEYLFARTFISRSENMVVSVGISTFIGEYTVFWHQIMAAAAHQRPACLHHLRFPAVSVQAWQRRRQRLIVV